MADEYWRHACLDAVNAVQSAVKKDGSMQSSSGFVLAAFTVKFGFDAAILELCL
jgi:hypothetical protein